MNATILKAVNKVSMDISKIAMKHGYQADFSNVGEGKGVEFKMMVSFRKPEIKGGAQMEITELNRRHR